MRTSQQRLLYPLLMALIALFGGSPVLAQQPPFSLPPPQELHRIRSAEITTDRGSLYFELFPEDAPWHVANFKYRADHGLYRGSNFHIFYADYIIQGGIPTDKTAPRYTLPAEFNRHRNVRGALGMARWGDQINRERRSSGSQFHILLGESSRMDGEYTVFGRLVGGDSVLDLLKKGDIIKDVRVFVEKSAEGAK